MKNLMVETEWKGTVPPAVRRSEACKQEDENDLRASRPAFA
ncbi:MULTISPECIES: hypothetical protein [Burkholderia]|nr:MULTISPECIES: hypothetical protein [Burkholderia]